MTQASAVEALLFAALEKPSAAERTAFLDSACLGNSELRRQVEKLLKAHADVGDFLNRPVVEQLAEPPDEPAATQAISAGANQKGPAMPPTEGEGSNGENIPLDFLQPSTRPDSLGRIGHYEVLQILGRGGFGIVFRAFDETLQRVVALKVMAPQLAATSPARKRFLREARCSAQVRHENVVQVYEVAEQPLPYLAMEFIPGETLQQRLDRVGPIDVPETLLIGRQIAEGLAAAHATDLIHRDIKPGNVLLEGGQHKVKITDFGLARAADDASISQSGIIAGTPMYMAPEQAKGEKIDQRADLFSLGSVLYQMVAGRPPFRANSTLSVLKRVAEDTPRSIREIIPETPQWLCDIIAKLHAKNPDERFQSARDVADVLADCEAQLKANHKLKDFSRIPQRKQPAAGKSGQWKWVAAAAVLLPVLALVVTHLLRELPPPANPPKPVDGPVVDQKKDADRQAAEWVLSLGGRATIGVGGQGFPVREIRELPAEAFQVVVVVLDGNSRISDAELVRLKALTKLQSLYLGKSPVSDAGTAHLKTMTNLAYLDLRGTKVTAGSVEALSKALPKCMIDYDGGVVGPHKWVKADGSAIGSPLADGWVQLFNGKDLTGWKTHPDKPGNWRVENNLLTGSGMQSHLFSERGDYENFHLRAVAKINQGGNSGILFRSKFDHDFDLQYRKLVIKMPFGFEVELASASENITGSVLRLGPTFALYRAQTKPTPHDTWFTLEIIVRGKHVITKVDGQQARDVELPDPVPQKGHVALQVYITPGTVVQFKSIEIKELPSAMPGWVRPDSSLERPAGAQLWRHMDQQAQRTAGGPDAADGNELGEPDGS